MGTAGIQFVPYPAHSQAPEVGARAREIQELWFNLARLRWASLVVIPAGEGISAEGIARSLADVGSRLRDSPVTAILASSMDYESARFLADLELRVRDHRTPVDMPPAVDLDAREVVGSASTGDAPAEPSDRAEPSRAAAASAARMRDASMLPPVGQVIVAIQPIFVEPLGVAIAHAADAVLLCVKLGDTRLRSVRKTLEMIGHTRSVSALLVR
jgi:hypothetical protein